MASQVDAVTSSPKSGDLSDRQKKDESTPLDNCLLKNKSYNFNNKERGVAIIINNKYFEEKTGQKERVGSEVDAQLMESAFLRLGFEVIRHDDVTTTELSEIMYNAAAKDYSDVDCFTCVLMSHGLEGRLFCSNGAIHIDFLINRFKGEQCPTLVGKPKLFFIQACRGAKYDHGVEVAEDLDSTDSYPASVERVVKIPEEADFLLSYSVVPGFFSWRNSVDGSWYVQALARVLDNCAEDLDLLHMLTLVNNLVAYRFQSDTDYEWTDEMKQMPSFVSRLTKLVYLKPKW